MTLDTQNEKLIPLRGIPDLPWLPPRARGKRLSLNTVHTWARSGLRGVVLETVSVGDTACTTEAALMRFFERVNEAKNPQRKTLAKGQAQAQERARATLERMGIRKGATR
jgi:hypothetical protein